MPGLPSVTPSWVLFAAGKALGKEGLQISETVAHPGSLMFPSWGIGLLSLCQGDLCRALPLLERAVGICHEADFQAFPFDGGGLGRAIRAERTRRRRRAAAHTGTGTTIATTW